MTRTFRHFPAAEVDVRDAYTQVCNSVRRALLRKFPYRLFDVIEPDAVVVLACFHVRPGPESWQDRV